MSHVDHRERCANKELLLSKKAVKASWLPRYRKCSRYRTSREAHIRG